MTCDDVLAKLGETMDGPADSATAAAVRRHLSGCASCRAVAADLSSIREAARTLGAIAPPPRVWAAVEARVRAEAVVATPPRQQWLAAAAGFVLIASGLSWLGAHLPAPPTAPDVAASVPGDRFEQAAAAYQSAIDDLESITAAADAPALAEPAFAALQAGLADLDDAIGEARGQLRSEPGDELSQDSLLVALDYKVSLLQDAVALLDQEAAGLEGTNR